MSDTPRTDSICACPDCVSQYCALARQLERELAQAANSFYDATKDAADWKARFEGKVAYLRELQALHDQERFRPLGDNHHNAVACPYCNPRREEFAPAGVVAYAVALHHELTVLHDAMRLCDGRTDPPYHKSTRCQVVTDLLKESQPRRLNQATEALSAQAGAGEPGINSEASGAGGAGTPEEPHDCSWCKTRHVGYSIADCAELTAIADKSRHETCTKSYVATTLDSINSAIGAINAGHPEVAADFLRAERSRHQSCTQPDADTPDDAKRMEAIKARVQAIIDRDELPTPAECDLVWLTRCVPQVSNSPWIDASVQFPDEDGRYFIVYRHNGTKGITRAFIGDYCGGEWLSMPGDSEVVLWMPVPDFEFVACTKQEER